MEQWLADRKTRYVMLGLGLALGAVLLGIRPAADAPPGVTNSAGYYFDPPSKCHNARNLALYGKWMTDEWAPFLHSPVYSLAQSLNFRLLGVGYIQMRLLTIAASVLTLALVYLLVARHAGYVAGLAALGLTATNYTFILSGRSGLLEPLETLFLLSALCCTARGYAVSGSPGARGWMAAAGLAGALAFLSKAFAAFFLVPLLAVVLLAPPRRRSDGLWLLGAAAVPLLLYAGPFRHANAAFLEREKSHWIMRAAAGKPWGNLWFRQPPFPSLQFEWGLALIALLAMPRCLTALGNRETRGRNAALGVLALGWIAYTQLLASVNYRPDRYYFPLLPMAIALSAIALAHAFRWFRDPRELRVRLFSGVFIYWPLLTFAFKFGLMDPVVLGLLPRGTVSHTQRLAAAAALGGGILLGNRLLGRHVVRGLRAVPAALRTGVAILGLAALGAVYAWHNLHPYEMWARDPQHTMHGFSRLLGERYRDMVIAGPSPLFAVMENRHRALKVTPYHLNWDGMRRGKVTHLMLPVVGGSIEFDKKVFPEIMARATLLDRVSFCGVRHEFFAVDLRPLEVTAAVEPGRDVSVLTAVFRNPDPHNPQQLDLLVFSERDGQPAVAAVQSVEVPPLGEERVRVDVERSAAPYTCCALSPRLYVDSEEGCSSAGTYLLDDVLARRLYARTFRRPRKTVTAPVAGYVSLPVGVEKQEPYFVAARVRGTPEPGDRLEFQWVREGEVLASRDAPGFAGIRPDGYVLLADVSPPPCTGDLELRAGFIGHGVLFVDGLAALPVRDVRGEAVLQRVFTRSDLRPRR